MTDVIQTEDLTKHYGKVNAAEAVDLKIKQGEIYGFLGLNGAGKTTTIRMLLGMIRPTRGKAYLFGKKVDPGNMDLWNKVGHLVEIPYSYPELTVLENLEIFRRLRLLKDPNLLTEIIDKLHLGPYRNIKFKNLSLGNAQRLGIAKAMMHHPGLLILDEPANGLDPSGIVQIRELLIDLAGNHGVTIFISSHILGEISRFATRIGIIHEGHMIRESDVDQLKNSRHRALHVNTLDNKRAHELLISQGYSPGHLPDGSLEMPGDSAISHPEKISAMLALQGLAPTRIAVEEEDLEHYFFRIIQTNSRQS
ncbi:MAG: bacitracin ABC transporter ATP-binding protein [Bacteroides sp. SM1_62]|nr:MAG: bacitracin ABC transporter ATP-binding protein [Bacteroides sp. SM1_62]